MPIHYARGLTARQRSAATNRHLGCMLAFVAGSINAGGFIAVRQYTSHMTGIVSAMADGLASGAFELVLAGLGALLSFVIGAASSAMLIHYARRRRLSVEYAAPLLLEAALLLLFGALGARLAQLHWLFLPATVMLLSFIMGLQNALMTKLSRAEIRTTHVTGTVTDIGIELGKLLYMNRSDQAAPVRADRSRLAFLVGLLMSFFSGGVAGAFGFSTFGYAWTVPVALFLVAIAAVPALDDLRALGRRQVAKSPRQ